VRLQLGTEQRLGVGDAARQRHRLRRHIALVREGLQPRGQPREPVDHAGDALQVAAHVVEPLVLEQDAGAVGQGAQRRQRLVQLVHHAGRHLAERGHLAGMHQLALRRAQLRGARDDGRLEAVVRRLQRGLARELLAHRAPALPQRHRASSSTAIARLAVIAA
jgi:hypothetical protein